MQLITDLKNGVTIGQTIAPVSDSAGANGAAVDLQNGDVRTHVIISNGIVTAAAIWTVQMQSSPDNTNWTNEADPNALSGQITAIGVTLLSYQRTSRYARAVTTLVSGTSSILDILILAEKKFEPAGAGYDRSPST
jgi:hypothetical protein